MKKSNPLDEMNKKFSDQKDADRKEREKFLVFEISQHQAKVIKMFPGQKKNLG